MHQPLTPCEHQSWQMSDGYVVNGRVWPARDRAIRPAIIYLHGIQSHGAWFEWSASVLAQAGNMVVLPDRRGSGLNDEARGDTPTRNRWLDDLDDLTQQLSEEHGVTRFAVCGVSWGGKLAIAWALRRPECVSRLLLVAPGLVAQVQPTLGERLSIAASLIVCPRRRHRIPLDDAALFTDNPAGQQFIEQDPLKLTHATARFMYNSLRLDWLLRGVRPDVLSTRTTLLLAERERIIHNDLTKLCLRRLCAEQPAVERLAAAHTIEFEQDLTAYEALLRHWADNAHGR